MNISERFLEVFDYLKNSKQVGSQKEFAKKIGISPSMFTEISNGRSGVGLSAIQNIVLNYDIDANWLLTGRGGISNKMYSANISQANDPFSILLLKVEEQAKQIGILEKELQLYKEEDSLIKSHAQRIETLEKEIAASRKKDSAPIVAEGACSVGVGK
mgnify:FL=1